MFTLFPNLETAQVHALQHGLRQRAVAYATRGDRDCPELLVFYHTPEYPTAGTQVPAGGLEAGESVLEGALREAWEESGLEGLTPRAYLGSVLYENGLLRQVWHFCWLEVSEVTTLRRGDRIATAPTPTLPDAWEHRAEEGLNSDGYTFLHRFEPLETAVLHYDMDALLPQLWSVLGYEVKEKAVCFVTRAADELLVFEGHKDGGLHVVRGNLESGESPSEAAKRELLEEAGLELGEPVSLGVSAFPLARAVREKYPADHPKQNQLWYYHHFHFTASPSTADAWMHRVSAGASDGGREYQFRFQPLETVRLPRGEGVGLDALKPGNGRTPLRPCAVAYITRGAGDTLELLTFTGHPWGGVQVIAGGIDPGETPIIAAKREIPEESGLKLEAGAYLGRHDYYVRLEDLQAHEARYCFHFHTSSELPDAWIHTVSSGEADKGLEYRFQWVRLQDVKLDWELGEFVPQAVAQIAQVHNLC